METFEQIAARLKDQRERPAKFAVGDRVEVRCTAIGAGGIGQGYTEPGVVAAVYLEPPRYDVDVKYERETICEWDQAGGSGAVRLKTFVADRAAGCLGDYVALGDRVMVYVADPANPRGSWRRGSIESFVPQGDGPQRAYVRHESVERHSHLDESRLTAARPAAAKRPKGNDHDANV